MELQLLNETETQRAVAAIEGISDWIRQLPADEQAKKYRTALESLHLAVTKTRSYQRHLEAGRQRDGATEDDLSHAWFGVAAEIRQYNPRLAELCEVKGHGWADQTVWNNPLIRRITNLDAMLTEYADGLKRVSEHEAGLARLKAAAFSIKFAEQKSLYDRTIQKLQNNKIVVGILLLVLVIAGAAKVLTGIASIREFFFPRKAPTKAESTFRSAARNNLSASEVTCLNGPHEQIPAGTRVCVDMHGSWLGPWAGGVAPWDKAHPTTVWTQAVENNEIISTESRYIHPNTFQEKTNFYICVRPPTGAAANISDRMAINIAASTEPCRAPGAP